MVNKNGRKHLSFSEFGRWQLLHFTYVAFMEVFREFVLLFNDLILADAGGRQQEVATAIKNAWVSSNRRI